jgi:hypothetical protein
VRWPLIPTAVMSSVTTSVETKSLFIDCSLKLN